MGPYEHADLPASVAEAVMRLGKAIDTGAVDSAEIAVVIAALEALPPQSAPVLDGVIANLAGLFRGYDTRPSLLRLFTPSRDHLDLLDRQRDLAPLFLFHRNGYVREAALAYLSAPPRSPFFLAVIAWRLNDWVRAVRIAARHYAERALPQTSPEIIADAAPFVLDRWRRWKRWEEANVEVVDRALQRPDVAPYLVDWLANCAVGPLGAMLRYALRGSSLDASLPALARNSVHPAVRAVALQTLIQRQASWPIGFGKEWVDKRYGLARQITLFAHRRVESQDGADVLIRMGLHDRSAAVRRVAADALIERRADFTNLDDAIAKLSSDKSPGLRERAAFLARSRLDETAGRAAVNPDPIVERVCFLPIEYGSGDLSTMEILRQSGFLAEPRALTREKILNVLHAHPELVSEWEQWSDDSRATEGWVFRTTDRGYSVFWRPGGETMTFPDRFEACAEFIFRQMRRTAGLDLEPPVRA
jgi:hypothetical protein